MKMQVRHVHAGIHRTGLRGLRRQAVKVGDSESVTRGSADDRGHRVSLVSEGIPAVFIDCIKGEGYNVIACLYLRWLRHRNSLGREASCEKDRYGEEQVPRVFSLTRRQFHFQLHLALPFPSSSQSLRLSA